MGGVCGKTEERLKAPAFAFFDKHWASARQAGFLFDKLRAGRFASDRIFDRTLRFGGSTRRQYFNFELGTQYL